VLDLLKYFHNTEEATTFWALSSLITCERISTSLTMKEWWPGLTPQCDEGDSAGSIRAAYDAKH
jgi:hypothetical protein